VRFGSYEDLPEQWRDLRSSNQNIQSKGGDNYTVCKTFRIRRRGNYGATMYAQLGDQGDKTWIGRGANEDLRFRIDSEPPKLIAALHRRAARRRAVTERLLNDRVYSYWSFERTMSVSASRQSGATCRAWSGMEQRSQRAARPALRLSLLRNREIDG